MYLVLNKKVILLTMLTKYDDIKSAMIKIFYLKEEEKGGFNVY